MEHLYKNQCRPKKVPIIIFCRRNYHPSKCQKKIGIPYNMTMYCWGATSWNQLVWSILPLVKVHRAKTTKTHIYWLKECMTSLTTVHDFVVLRINLPSRKLRALSSPLKKPVVGRYIYISFWPFGLCSGWFAASFSEGLRTLAIGDPCVHKSILVEKYQASGIKQNQRNVEKIQRAFVLFDET